MKKIVINEHMKTIVFSILFEIMLIAFFVDFLLRPEEYTSSRAGVFLFGPFIFPFIVAKGLKKKGTIEITDTYVYARYNNVLQRGYVDLTEPVYYCMYKDDDDCKCILLSNEKITLDAYTIYSDIDYGTQIPIRYTRRVKKIFPKEDWTEVVLRK